MWYGIVIIYGSPHSGLVNSFGEPWEQLRRFTLKQLRNFGFGKSSMETLIMDEVTEFIDGLEASNGKSIDNIQHRFSVAVVNALWTIVSGARYSHHDPKLSHLTSQVTKSFDATTNTGGLILFAPWVKHILPGLSGYTFIRKVMDELREFMIKTVETHKLTYASDNCPRDFIDVFLREISVTQDPTSSFYKDVGGKYFVGFDTTSKTLSWALLYLTKYPEAQEKLQNEIQRATENQRAVALTDRPNMPYTQSLIEEVLRLSSLLPVGVPHRVLWDTKFCGIFLPKDTNLFVNIYFIHHNPEIWGDPENFRPERFLSNDGQVFKKNENLMPFFVGKRECLGQSLARDTIFLFLTNIFQNWNIMLDPAAPEASLEPAPGFNVNPQSYSIVANKRHP
ncbi:Methyl farnesoate epoxidase [Orchesella cincta]|uniref:Methyl farnesoate epoxidase n=1 Tax=Orchesella cincta TaxID=48709 RepID=A0A1D2NKL7_ORCCI|nr:Methyl farnesoate epoxidase [Orchesella cincta]